MKLFDLSMELLEELDSPANISVASIQMWLASNIGKINALLGKSYTLDSTSAELTEDFGPKEGVIIKKLYLIHDLDRKIKTSLGASGTESFIEVSSDGGTIRRSNKTEIAKTYIQLRKDEYAELEMLINSYNISESQIFGINGDENTTYIDAPKPIRIRII